MSGAFRSVWVCRSVGHVPDLTPMDFALFTPAMPAASSGTSRPLPVAATAGARMADEATRNRSDAPRSQALHRHLRRIRVPCGDRRLHRESARLAPISERRHCGPAQRTAQQHGAMMARA